MNQRTFIILLLIIAAVLTGWIVWTTNQAVSAEPVEEITTKWWGSGHADFEAEAFNHWNEDDPPVIPETCAKCHGMSGFLDYVGQDGSAQFVVDKPARAPDTLACITCHNDPAWALDVVKLPSGIELKTEGHNAICMTCHSGMGAGSSVDKRTEGLELDTVIPDSSLISAHYFHAAAMHAGNDGKSGYQYEGKNYVGTFQHAEPVNTCIECHDQHSLDMRTSDSADKDMCSTCHSEVNGPEDYRKISMSKVDYDGDGAVEPVYDEIDGALATLYKAIQGYSAEKAAPFLFGENYPYVFNDTNGDGIAGEDETIFPNGYKSFTPRMLRATFNYMFVSKDPGKYVHNAKYALQLIYDSIEDLAEFSGVSTEGMVRP